METTRRITMEGNKETLSLPKDYQPNEFDIICGRGRGMFRQPGNIKFHAIMNAHIEEYARLKTKVKKSDMVDRLIKSILSQNNGNVHFLRYIPPLLSESSSSSSSSSTHAKGEWEALGCTLIREKVGHGIRDLLRTYIKGMQFHNKYKSEIASHADEMMKAKDNWTAEPYYNLLYGNRRTRNYTSDGNIRDDNRRKDEMWCKRRNIDLSAEKLSGVDVEDENNDDESCTQSIDAMRRRDKKRRYNAELFPDQSPRSLQPDDRSYRQRDTKMKPMNTIDNENIDESSSDDESSYAKPSEVVSLDTKIDDGPPEMPQTTPQLHVTNANEILPGQPLIGPNLGIIHVPNTNYHIINGRLICLQSMTPALVYNGIIQQPGHINYSNNMMALTEQILGNIQLPLTSLPILDPLSQLLQRQRDSVATSQPMQHSVARGSKPIQHTGASVTDTSNCANNDGSYRRREVQPDPVISGYRKEQHPERNDSFETFGIFKRPTQDWNGQKRVVPTPDLCPSMHGNQVMLPPPAMQMKPRIIMLPPPPLPVTVPTNFNQTTLPPPEMYQPTIDLIHRAPFGQGHMRYQRPFNQHNNSDRDAQRESVCNNRWNELVRETEGSLTSSQRLLHQLKNMMSQN